VYREHEWSKHGTCAMTLDSLSTELKYFSKGLELAQTYDLLRYGRNSLLSKKFCCIRRYFVNVK